MKVLIICSGNSPDNQDFDLKLHHAFIYEQVEELKKAGIIFDFFFIKGKGVSGYINSILQLRKRLKAGDIDIIHTHYGLSGVVGAFQRKNKFVATFHGCDVNRKRLNILSSVVALKSKANIFVSEDLRRKILLKTTSKNHVIPCGIDLNMFKPVDKVEARKELKMDLDKRYVLFASSFSTLVKNYSLAKMAVEKLQGVELIELSEKTREEVNLLMNAVDMFLLTSFREGSPQTIKEAMSCNCPIVSTNVGDISYVIKDVEGCFLTTFNPVDVTEKLRNAFEFVKINKRTKGRTRIIELGLDGESSAKKVLAVYKSVLQKNKD